MLRTFYSRIANHRLNRRKLKAFKEQFNLFTNLDHSMRFRINYDDIYPCLDDNTAYTGFDSHYVYHPAWAARVVKEINPVKHVDISSSLHFCSMLSAFVPVDFYDFRPARLNLSNLNALAGDLTCLPFEDNSIECISCMHTIEHIGLGRYGDPIDPDGDIKAINELKRVAKVNGSILFVTPVGHPKIVFNAHRIYHPNMITELFYGFEMKQFSLITDQNDFIEGATLEEAAKQNYGCGCFWFVKKS